MEKQAEPSKLSSEVFKERIELISQCSSSTPSSERSCNVIEDLITCWEEESCCGLFHCKCHMYIIHVALQCLQNVDACDVLCRYVILSTKATKWCRSHFSSLLEQVSGFLEEEDHVIAFIELFLQSLNFASAIFTVFIKSSYLVEDYLIESIEDLILEQFNILKISLSDLKRLHSNESGVLKAMQELIVSLTAVISEKLLKIVTPLSNGGKETFPISVNIASYAIENLYEIGIMAATRGRNLIAILNISWKAVVSLLQLEGIKENLPGKVNIADIILALLSLAMDSLKAVSKSWSNLLTECEANCRSVTDTEARRSCIPIKFYLRIALQISSTYPCEALKVECDITSCVLKVSTVCAFLSTDEVLGTAYEAAANSLEPVVLFFLCFLLKSNGAGVEFKQQILDKLFPEIEHLPRSESSEQFQASEETVEEIFSSTSKEGRLTLLGRVRVLLNLLQNSTDLGTEAVKRVSQKLDWLLDALVQDNIYAAVLQTHSKSAISNSATESSWNFMFPYILHSMKTFFIFSASNEVFMEIKSFLFQNIVHPHTLCWTLVLELWCFMVRHAEFDVIEQSVDSICSLFRSIAISVSVPSVKALKKLSRSLCMILKHVPRAMVEQAYCNLTCEDGIPSKASQVIISALVQEGFPLCLLTKKSKQCATEKIIGIFSAFVSKFCGSDLIDVSSLALEFPEESICGFTGLLSQCKLEELELQDEFVSKIPRLALHILNAYSLVSDPTQKHYYSVLLSSVLEATSYMVQRLKMNAIQELLIGLNGLLATDDSTTNGISVEFKLAVAVFLESLSIASIPEDENDPVSRAVWKLYHFILKERHWAGVHNGLSSFGYFAAHSSCNELWRFVPSDATLSFDMESGKYTGDLFMSELTSYLAKDVALDTLLTNKEEKYRLIREGCLQNEKMKNQLQEVSLCAEKSENNEVNIENEMEIDAEVSHSQRTHSDEINKGLALIKEGLSLLTSHFKQSHHDDSDSTQKQDFSVHLSCLSDIVKQMENNFK